MDAGQSNLTGVWQGLYAYSRLLPPVSFVATLIESSCWVSGSTHEPHRKTGETLCATLQGRRHGFVLNFVKTYEKTGDGYKHDIHYEGAISPDGTEIDGRWHIRADWSGRFLMIRSRPRAEEIARKRFAEVS